MPIFQHAEIQVPALELSLPGQGRGVLFHTLATSRKTRGTEQLSPAAAPITTPRKFLSRSISCAYRRFRPRCCQCPRASSAMIVAVGVDKPSHFEIGFVLQKTYFSYGFHLRKSLLRRPWAGQPRQSLPAAVSKGMECERDMPLQFTRVVININRCNVIVQ
jgi:hypothetical protein